MSNIYVFSDIHGEFYKLQALIKRLFIKEDDVLVFLGDYIDRSNKTFEVIGYLIKLGKKYNCKFLLGNHEEMFIDYMSGIHEHIFIQNGGFKTVESYASHGFNIGRPQNYRDRELPKDHEEFFNNLIPYYETSDFIFVHAGIVPGVPLERTPKEYLIWSRNFVFEDYFDKPVVFGHTPSREIMNLESQICIDTGACFESMGDLTCVKLPERVFYRQGPTIEDMK